MNNKSLISLELIVAMSFLVGCNCNSSCNKYIPPVWPGWCQYGTVVDGGKDDCGCELPPKCENVACPEDAKLCSDGITTVVRQPPYCEFAACPDELAKIAISLPQ